MGFKEDREERGWVGRRRRIGGRDKNREEVGLEYLRERKRAERKRKRKKNRAKALMKGEVRAEDAGKVCERRISSWSWKRYISISPLST